MRSQNRFIIAQILFFSIANFIARPGQAAPDHELNNIDELGNRLSQGFSLETKLIDGRKYEHITMACEGQKPFNKIHCKIKRDEVYKSTEEQVLRNWSSQPSREMERNTCHFGSDSFEIDLKNISNLKWSGSSTGTNCKENYEYKLDLGTKEWTFSNEITKYNKNDKVCAFLESELNKPEIYTPLDGFQVKMHCEYVSP